MRKLKYLFILLLVLLLATTTVFAGGSKEKQQTVQEDLSWDEIVKRAKEEGEVVVYTTTSRVSDAAKLFEEKYGIKVTSHRLTEVETISRLSQEAQAGVVGADLAIVEDYPSIKRLLIDTNVLFNYIPPTAKEFVLKEEQTPLCFAHVSRIIGYNSEKYSSDPLDSIWDLTTDKWKGKVMLRDLAITGEHQNFFSELVRRADILEADYERRFGKKLELREDNAAYEFMRRLIENDVVLRTSDTKICDAVGKKGQSDPPIGLIYVYSKHRHAPKKDLAVSYSDKVLPFGGYYYNQYIQQLTGQKHPNAAKLFTEFLMTKEGFSPWAKELGFYSTNQSVKDVGADGKNWDYWKTRLWTYDADFAVSEKGNILDKWISFIN